MIARVIKIGGSTLRSSHSIRKVLAVIESYSEPLVIVISALYGITDELSGALQGILADQNRIPELSSRIFLRHDRLLRRYVTDPSSCEKARQKIKGRLEELENNLRGIHYLGEIPPFVKDRILSFGERLSSLLLSVILGDRGEQNREMLPEDLGLITDGVFNDASVNFEVSEPRVREQVTKQGCHLVVPGFYGHSPEGKTTLFGRGGSDYTAASIARCIQARQLDIYKDVTGFMTIDPKGFAEAKTIDYLSYEEAAELSYFGAKILHPRTFEPLIDRGISLRLFDIRHCENPPRPSTVVDNGGRKSPQVVKSITSSKDFGILRLHGPRVGIKPGIMARVTTRLHEARINIKSIITAQTCINILLGRQDLDRGYRLIRALSLPSLDQVVRMDGISLIAVVGEGMLSSPGIAARIFQAVSEHRINVMIIAAGASRVATYFVVDQGDLRIALAAIHREFFQ